MPTTFRYISSSLLLLLCAGLQLLAQDKKVVPVDTVTTKKWPTGIRIGTDLITLSKNFYNSPLTGWEINADADLGRYYATLDFGHSSRNEEIKNGTYKNTGNYWRAGVDVNFLLKDPDKNMFFLGFRFAHANFDETLNYVAATNNFGDVDYTANNLNLSANWLELTTGLRVKIWKPIWMGYTARMKFLPSTNGAAEMEVYNIPGFGMTAKNLYWGFNYQLFFRFPIRKPK